MHAINLVPDACRHEQARAARLQRWIAIAAVALVVSTVPVVHLMLSRAETGRLASSFQRLQDQLTALQKRCEAAKTERESLKAQASLIAAPTDTSRVPEALARIAAAAPDGLMLTRISLTTPTKTANPALPSRSEGAAAATPTTAARVFTIEGLAADHTVVLAFSKVVEAAPACHRVQLVRSQRIQSSMGELQAFTLECDWEDGA